MPFTFAHPAAVLPLRRARYLQTLPLVIGSLVPDVPYFFPPRLARPLMDTHSLYGSFAVCLPLGMVMLIATVLLREPLAALLSARARWVFLRSIERFSERPWHWPIALGSILVGAWTHIAWDSFTHPAGWTAMRVHRLNRLVSIFGWETELSHLLQYVSSVFGLVIVAIWLRRLLAQAPSSCETGPLRDRSRRLTLIAIALAALVIGVSRALMAWRWGAYYHLVYLLLTRTIGCFAALYVMTGLLVSRNRRWVAEPTG